jgi:hypothetical protein
MSLLILVCFLYRMSIAVVPDMFCDQELAESHNQAREKSIHIEVQPIPVSACLCVPQVLITCVKLILIFYL